MTTTPDTQLEIKLIQRFIAKSKQERFLGFIKSEKTRIKFIDELHSMNFLALDLFIKVTGNEHAVIKERIKSLGNLKDCYIISENRGIDKQRMDIDTALSKVIAANMGSLIIFGDAEIVYSEAEGFNNRWISK